MATGYATTTVPFKNPLYMTPGVQAANTAASTINRIPQPAAAPKKATTQPKSTYDPVAAARAAAAQQEAARIAALERSIQVGFEGIQSGGSTSLRDLTNTYGTNNRNTVQSIQSSQEDINRSRENTALNLRRSMSGIVDSIRQGLRSGAVQLANINASDSGATEALARAYARMGNQQVGDVRNQAALANRDTDVLQKKVDQQEQNALADFATYRSTETDRISNDLYNQLRVLDANAAAQGVNGKVDLGLRDRLINDAIAKLNAIDQQTTQALAGINPLTQDQIYANAAQLDAQGAAGGNPFSYQIPTGGLTGGPAYSSVGDLPIYYRRNDQLGA